MKKFLLFLLLLLFPCIAFAHGGRTDSSGCHTNRKTGDYHCHGAPDNPGRSNYSNNINSIPTYTNYNAQRVYETSNKNTTTTTTSIPISPRNTTTHSINNTNYSNTSSSSRNTSKKDDDGIGWFWILVIGGIIGWIFYNPKQ